MNVLLISPYRSAEKHPANPLAIKQRFLNFGLLSLASHLQREGHAVEVFDEYCREGSEHEFERFVECAPQPDVVGVSCISAFSADRCVEILSAAKAAWPRAVRVIGGQHFVGNLGTDFTSFFEDANCLIAGEAEASFAQFLHALQNAGGVFGNVGLDEVCDSVFLRRERSREVVVGRQAVRPIVPLDEALLLEFGVYAGASRLFPSVEFSRGCPYACVFCANNIDNRRGYRRASPKAVAGAISRLARFDPSRPLSFYMQASNFSVSDDDAKALADELAKLDFEFSWRTEIRADEISETAIQVLAQVGLKFLDIGLESASPSTLRIMNKTRNPSRYLERSSELLTAAFEASIATKVNFLIHPGDTHGSVGESRVWLDSNRRNISGISSGVAIEYPGTPLSLRMSEFESRFGTRRHDHVLSPWGVFNLSPSRELGNEAAEALALEISQDLQTREDFARSKSFGYSGQGVDYEQLLKDLPEADHSTPYGGTSHERHPFR